MDTLTITLSPEVHRQLKKKAEQAELPPETVAQELLTRQLLPLAEEAGHVLREASLVIGYGPHIRPVPVAQPDAETEREKLARLLHKAGMLSEIGPRMRRLVKTTPIDHDEAIAILARAEGKPLSEIILEQRGPRE